MSTVQKSSLFRAVAATGMVNGLSMLLGIVSGVLTARGLGPDDRGEFVSLMVWSATVGSLALVGLDEAIIYQSGGRVERAWGLRSSLAPDAALQTAVGAAAMFVVGHHVVQPAGLGDWVTVVLVSSLVVLNTFNLMSLAPIRAARRLVIWNIVRLAQPLIFSCGCGALFLTDRLTVSSGVLVAVCGGISTAGLLAVFARLDKRDVLPADETAAARRYGRGLLMATLPQRISAKADQMLMALFLSSAVLGVYSVATSVASIVVMVGISLDQVLFPRYVAGRSQRRSVLGTAASGMLLALAISAGIVVLARPLISAVYGPDYIDATKPLMFLLCAAILQTGSATFGAALRAVGALRALSLAYTAGLIAFLVLFGPATRLGTGGVAVAVAGGTAVTFALLGAAVWRSGSGMRVSAAEQ